MCQLVRTVVLCWTIASTVPLAAGKTILELRAGDHERAGVPVVTYLPEGVSPDGDLKLVPSDGGAVVRAQRVPGEGKTAIAWVVRRPLPAGERRRYVLEGGGEQREGPGPPAVSCEVDDDENVSVTVSGRPVIRYNAAVVRPPEPGLEKFSCSGFIHPVRSPGGVVITDVFAPDHRHQRGIFFTWTKSFFEGRELNFWEVQAGTGRDEHVKLESAVSGSVFGSFVARRRFVDLTALGGPKPVLGDRWTVTVFNVPGGFLFDLESVQRCATDSPFTAGPYHYGAMAVRGTREWLKPASARAFSMRTSGGLDRKQGNHTRPDWVDFGGEVSGAAAGMTVFCNPQNPRARQFVRLHPDKPYFCFFPMLEEALTIAPGETYRSRFRFFVYDGEKDAARAVRLWRDYAEPPEVVVVE